MPKVHVKSLSHSTVTGYVGCSQKVWYEKIEHRKRRGTSVNLLFGTGIHSAVAAYYRSLLVRQPLKPEDLLRVFGIRFNQVPASELIEGKKSVEEMFEDARNLLNLLVELPQPKTIIAIEKAIQFQLTSSLSVVCQPDLIVRDNEGYLTVIDLKTSAKVYSEEQVRSVCEQVYLYSLAFSAEPVRLKARVFLKKKKVEILDIDLDPSSINHDDLVDKYIMVARSLEAGIHYRNRSWMCGGCSFRYLCDLPAEAEMERLAA